MKKVRYGIIGVGVQGKKYADLIQSGKMENSVLTALCTTSEEKKTKLEDEYQDVSVFLDYKDMIKSKEVDAIITTCPSQYHTEIARNALVMGVSVLNEKPAGINSRQVSNLNAIYKRFKSKNNVSYGLVFNQRTNTIYQEIKKIIETKQLGDFRRINWIQNSWYRPKEYYESGFWRAKYSQEGGGLIINQAQHTLDLFYYMVGLPKKVFAKTLLGYQRDITTDSDVSVIFEYENGATGNYVSCTHDMMGTDRLEIDLSGGKIIVENEQCTIYTFFKDEKEVNLTYSNAEYKNIENIFIDKKIITNQNNAPDKQYLMIIENFSNNILNGEPLIADGLDSGFSVQMSDAINLSNYYGKELTIPVDEDDYLKFLAGKIIAENKKQ